jgi:hypothetical protein
MSRACRIARQWVIAPGNGGVAYAMQTAVNGGSELLILRPASGSQP